VQFYSNYKRRYCRWCSVSYKPERDTGRDGFCCTAHKQAHYRVYKAWLENRVTHARAATGPGRPRSSRNK